MTSTYLPLGVSLRNILVGILLALLFSTVQSCQWRWLPEDDHASTSALNLISAQNSMNTLSLKDYIPAHQRDNSWFLQAEKKLTGRQNSLAGAMDQHNKRAKNVVLFVGDGMGISTITAARIFAGQKRGMQGEEFELSFEKFPFSGLAKTYNVDAQVPDSAGTMTAMVTGVKTRFGVLSIDEAHERGQCEGADTAELITLLELAEIAGKKTGIVSTTRLTHATPAAHYAKAADRNWESESPEGCEDIASQFVSFESRLNQKLADHSMTSEKPVTLESDGVDVALGGGARHFYPSNKTGGQREDRRDLVSEWLELRSDRKFVSTKNALENAKPDGQLLGLFSDSHMGYALQRQDASRSQPSLTEMTMKALDFLEDHEEGYYLQVEAGRIDHAHHAGNAYNALNDTVELDETIASVMERVDINETLIIVTADHSHVMTIAGYPRRGNPILSYVDPVTSLNYDDRALDGQPYTTLSYANGRGSHDFHDETDADVVYVEEVAAGRRALDADPTAPGYHQEALVPLPMETHAGEDVAVYAIGPGASLLSGTYEQNYLFHVMRYSAGL